MFAGILPLNFLLKTFHSVIIYICFKIRAWKVQDSLSRNEIPFFFGKIVPNNSYMKAIKS